jgi:hypothetical protein
MAIIREITFGDGTVVRITDWGDYPVYSRAVWDAENLVQLVETFIFNYQVGAMMPVTNQRATYADTNMPGTGQLPMGHQMLVYSLQVIPDEFAYVDGDTNKPNPLWMTPAANVTAAYWKFRKIFHQTMLHLVVEQTKSFVEGRLDHFPAGGGFLLDHNSLVDDAASPGEAGYQVNNGIKSWAATRRLAMPVHLGSLENFYVSLDWPRGGLGIDQSVDPNYEAWTGFGILIRLTGPRQRPTG